MGGDSVVSNDHSDPQRHTQTYSLTIPLPQHTHTHTHTQYEYGDGSGWERAAGVEKASMSGVTGFDEQLL